LSDNPWNHLGYWRLSDSSISLSIDNVVYSIEINLSTKAVHSFTMNGISTQFDIENESGGTLIKIKGVSKQVTSVHDKKNNNWISCENTQYSLSLPGLLENYPETTEGLELESNFNTGEIKSPLYGKILEINVKENQIIKKGDLLVVIEAMKSENRILSPKDALVKSIAINVGVQVSDQMPLIYLEDLIV
jgi:biotin carboxyl carrier protein